MTGQKRKTRTKKLSQLQRCGSGQLGGGGGQLGGSAALAVAAAHQEARRQHGSGGS
jgi:hypothetical protein